MATSCHPRPTRPASHQLALALVLFLSASPLLVASAIRVSTLHTTGTSSSALPSTHPQHTASIASAAALPLEPSAEPEDLVRCINQNQPPAGAGTTWTAALRDVPARYEVIGMWWSNKTTSLPLTIATQLSYSRKWQLKAMCQSWPGPISAAMHVPQLRLPDSQLPAGVTRERMDARLAAYKASVVVKMREVHERLNARCDCKLDLMLVHEQYADERSLMLYPVNVLRNFARLQARTPLVGLIDVDVLLSRSLSRELAEARTAARYIVEATEQKKVWVLPAFITTGKTLWGQMQLARELVGGTKEQLLPLFDQNVIRRFDPDSVGHQPTQYPKWFATAKPYEVLWRERYEPWVFSERGQVPWADARFRGYGKNKIIILQALNYTGYRFVVHPQAFLIHRAHPSSSVKTLHGFEHATRRGKRGSDAGSTVFGHNAWLNDQVEQGILNGTYTPQVDAAVLACVRDLSWWQPDSLGAAAERARQVLQQQEPQV